MQIQPYLFFEGRCEEALGFYRDKLGAEILMMMRQRENPEPPAQSRTPPGSEDKIMHAALRIGDATIMASDGMCSGSPEFKGVSLTMNVPGEEEARRRFEALSEGGEIVMPLQRTFFSPAFGVVRDPFGVSWMILTAAEGQA